MVKEVKGIYTLFLSLKHEDYRTKKCKQWPNGEAEIWTARSVIDCGEIKKFILEASAA